MTDGTPAAGETPGGTPPGGTEAPSFDTSVAHVARVYDCWLGGKDNFAADRVAAERAIEAYPDIVYSVRVQEWRPDTEIEAKSPAALQAAWAQGLTEAPRPAYRPIFPRTPARPPRILTRSGVRVREDAYLPDAGRVVGVPGS